jgi:hypothetical protein
MAKLAASPRISLTRRHSTYVKLVKAAHTLIIAKVLGLYSWQRSFLNPVVTVRQSRFSRLVTVQGA